MDGGDACALSVASWVTADSSSPLTEDARTGKVLLFGPLACSAR